MAESEYEVVWSGGELMPPAPQELYQLQIAGKRTLGSLGLIRWGDSGEVLSQDAMVSREEKQLVPLWRKHLRRQRRIATDSLRPEMIDGPTAAKGNWSRHKARLTDETVRRIRRAYANGEGSYVTLGTRFGLSGAGINAIVHRSIYKQVQD